MKYNWKESRKKENLNIPQRYLEKSKEQQNRRELTFLIQEAAFSEKVPLFHILDLENCEDKEAFLKEMPEAKAVIYMGIPIHDEFLLKEQIVQGITTEKMTTIAQLTVENYLWNFSEKIEIQGYETKRVLPVIAPHKEFAEKISLSAAGYAGKNGRFICEAYGCKVCMGYLITDAPLMSGDYQDSAIGRFENPCIDCIACMDVCPTKAINSDGIHAEKCMPGCHKCMEQCPTGDTILWDKYKFIYRKNFRTYSINSSDHFSRAFKKYYSCSPQQYRHQNGKTSFY